MSSTSLSNTDTVRTQDNRVRVSDKLVRALEAPDRGNRVVYDAGLRGFGVRVTAKGVHSFVLNYRINGRERRITIGQYPSWTVLTARKQAEEFRRRIDQGDDPLELRNDARSAPTVRDLFERYAAEHLPTKSPRSAADDRSMWVNTILPKLGAKKVNQITSDHCDTLHREISTTRPTRANRVIEVLRKALNLAMRWGWIERNPASGVRRNPEVKRTRYLSHEEIARLTAALDAHPQRNSADAILFMLLTGCRRGEALNAAWAQFDLAHRVWTKPAATTKQRREHRVPYSAAVADLLHRRRDETGGTHTFASLLASSGSSLPIVGAMLGHTQTQTRARYAHLYDDSLRLAAESVSDSIQKRTV